MKEKRSFLNKIFNIKQEKTNETLSKTTYQIFNGYNSLYTSVGARLYDNDIVRSCIDTIARHCAKFEPKHVKVADATRQYMKGDINYLLNTKPNEIMTTYDFIYKIVSLLYVQNNTFVFTDIEDGMIQGFYPISYTSCEFLKDDDSNLYIGFWISNGKKYILPYNNLITLRRFYSDDLVFGESNKALIPAIQTQLTANEGIANAVKTSTSLRGIIKYQQNLKAEDIKKNRDDFVADFVNMENTSGIAALDGKGEFRELNIKPITLDKDQLEHVDQRVLNYFGLNKSILSSDFSPEQWNAFYESVLEPIAIYLSQSFTSGIFGKQAIKQGNRIEFTVNRVQYASADTKIKIVKEAGALGVLTIDTILGILDLPTIGGEEGAKRLQSLNYVNSELVDEYQLGGEKDE